MPFFYDGGGLGHVVQAWVGIDSWLLLVLINWGLKPTFWGTSLHEITRGQVSDSHEMGIRFFLNYLERVSLLFSFFDWRMIDDLCFFWDLPCFSAVILHSDRTKPFLSLDFLFACRTFTAFDVPFLFLFSLFNWGGEDWLHSLFSCALADKHTNIVITAIIVLF